MADRIGKYEIVERIGRGGMGTVYKARDTRLNRMVALKVVSPEVELTDELRQRFFDEAQACAGLSHPNIVTIYDVGEEDDRLYIVMELLDGQELKRLIADHAVLSIEDKVSVMIQLCDALAYAHDKGIIHRDIKPGNILFQRTGPAKIIDFGIAKMATSSSLTRTGLIMGTLRYMSPEQVRGRADKRSDQFSLSAVFYEMLSFRPPYIGEDPIQLLEQLRAETPPSLIDLDPSIPPQLAAIVERGMSKEPSERYADLRAMRDDLEVVQRRIHEESQRLRTRFAALMTEVQEADAAAAARLGGPVFDAPLSLSDTQPLIVALHDKIGVVEARLESLQEWTQKLNSAEGAVQKGRELVQAERFGDARVALEPVVAEIPQYVVARNLLQQAQTGEDLQRRQQRGRELLIEAQSALQAQDPGRCLALVQNAADLPAPRELDDQIAALRRAAKTLQSEQDASRRARQQAERAREHVVEARKHAEEQEAQKYAAEAWSAAAAKNSEGEERLGEEKFSDALLCFDAAADRFASAEEEARDRKLEARRAAEEAKAAERLQLANKLLAEVHSEFAGRAYVRCQEILRQIEEIPPPDGVRDEFRRLSQETEAALQNERRSRKPAQQARMVMTAMRADAQAEGAPSLASGTWAEAEARASAGAAAFLRELFAEAHDVFEAATALFRQALEQARAAKPADQRAAQTPEASAAGDSPAGALLREARAALEQGNPQGCLDILTRAAMASPSAEMQQQISALLRSAADAALAKQQAADAAGDEKRRRTGHAAGLLEEALRSARKQGEPQAAPKTWAELEKKIASARGASARNEHDRAFADYEAAIQLAQRFADEARAARVAETGPPQRARAGSTEQPRSGASSTEQLERPVTARMPVLPGDLQFDDQTVLRTPSGRQPAVPAVPRAKAGRGRGLGLGSQILIALSGGAALAVAVALLFPRSLPRSVPTAQLRQLPPAAEAPAADSVRQEAEVAADEHAKIVAQLEADARARSAADAKATADAEAKAVAEAAAAAQARADEEGRGAAEARAARQAREEAEAKAASEANAIAQARLEADAKVAAERAKSDAEAKTAAEAKAAEEARAEKDRADSEARAVAKAQADAEARAAEQARSLTKANAEAKARETAEAKAKAKREAELAKAEAKKPKDEQAAAAKKLKDEQLAAKKLNDEQAAAKNLAETQIARARIEQPLEQPPAEPAAPKENSTLAKAYAVVFVEGTDGKKGGGAWGACWRSDLTAARACAKAGCDSTRRTGRSCQEIAMASPGGSCAIARASGFGVSAGVCLNSSEGAEGAAISSCLSQVRRTYGSVPASCKIVWSVR